MYVDELGDPRAADVPQPLTRSGWEFSPVGRRAGMWPGAVHQFDRSLIVDRAVGALLGIVPQAKLRALSASSRDTNQAVFRHSARTLPLKDCAKALSVGLPERLKSRGDAALIGPKIQVPGDEFRAVVDANDPRIANSLPGPVRVSGRRHWPCWRTADPARREPAEGVDDRQDADLAAVEQLVMQGVHGPGVVRPGLRLAILTQFGLDLPLGRLRS